MAAVRFEIEKYQITMGADLVSILTSHDVKVFGIIGCYGNGHQLMINFVKEGTQLPSSTYDSEKKTGAIFLPVSLMNNYMEILRNEKPLYAFCNKENPEWTNISTSHEPVGENERK